MHDACRWSWNGVSFFLLEFCQLQLFPLSLFYFFSHSSEHQETNRRKERIQPDTKIILSWQHREVKRKAWEIMTMGFLTRTMSCLEVIRRKFWHCPGYRQWPGCCGECQVWEQAMGGDSHQVCWQVGWGCWWWQQWNPVPHSSASGYLAEHSDWNDWGNKHNHHHFYCYYSTVASKLPLDCVVWNPLKILMLLPTIQCNSQGQFQQKVFIQGLNTDGSVQRISDRCV